VMRYCRGEFPRSRFAKILDRVMDRVCSLRLGSEMIQRGSSVYLRLQLITRLHICEPSRNQTLSRTPTALKEFVNQREI
jgi:hypothetical protein